MLKSSRHPYEFLMSGALPCGQAVDMGTFITSRPGRYVVILLCGIGAGAGLLVLAPALAVFLVAVVAAIWWCRYLERSTTSAR
jgi:hypothetical protein